jgi:hypothetical protein
MKKSHDVELSESTQQVEFGYRGVTYRASLTSKQAADLDLLMSTYIEAGRRRSDEGTRLRLTS